VFATVACLMVEFLAYNMAAAMQMTCTSVLVIKTDKCVACATACQIFVV